MYVQVGGQIHMNPQLSTKLCSDMIKFIVDFYLILNLIHPKQVESHTHKVSIVRTKGARMVSPETGNSIYAMSYIGVKDVEIAHYNKIKNCKVSKILRRIRKF